MAHPHQLEGTPVVTLKAFMEGGTAVLLAVVTEILTHNLIRNQVCYNTFIPVLAFISMLDACNTMASCYAIRHMCKLALSSRERLTFRKIAQFNSPKRGGDLSLT